MAVIAIALVLVAFGASSCGGGASSAPDRARDDPKAEERVGAKVVRKWADTLRAGDVAGAARLFGLPAIVSNGKPPVVLHSRSEVRAFNASLPCGARLLQSTSTGPVTRAVFRLTERPGAGRCGAGTGQTARTVFIVLEGKIREWRRVADPPERSGPIV